METALGEFSNRVREFLGLQEFLFPFVAAQHQFRERYYGLASAAMLEDLFFDSFSSFLDGKYPGESFERPPRGEKGYDYSFQGRRISHKVSKAGPIPVAALWDATRTDVKTWTFEDPICFISGAHSKIRLLFVHQASGRVNSFEALTASSTLTTKDAIIVARWHADQDYFALESILDFEGPGPGVEVVSFRKLWSQITALMGQGNAANQCEVFILRNFRKEDISVGHKFSLVEGIFRPGVYLFSQEILTNIPVTHNNRAVLIPKSAIAELMTQSLIKKQFIPLAVWFGAYAGDYPPNLYDSQRTAFEEFRRRALG